MSHNDIEMAGIARRTTLSLSVLVLLTGAAGTAAAQGGHGGGMAGGGTFGFGGVGLLWMVLLLAVPVILVYLLANGLGGGSSRGDSHPRNREEAVSVLRERYARGDLSDEEFERRRNRLQ